MSSTRIAGFLVLSIGSPLIAAHSSEDALGDEVLAKIAGANLRTQAVRYACVRRYEVRNYRFGRAASLSAQMRYQPEVGKTFWITERSGTIKLLEIVQTLLKLEAQASLSNNGADYDINPANYRAHVRSTEQIAGRQCYVLDLVPRHKSKYLFQGSVWVDAKTYGPVRLEGVASASVSIWVGAPHVTLEFGQLGDLWLPVRAGFVSSGLLVGASELEIRCLDYIVDTDVIVPANSSNQARSHP